MRIIFLLGLLSTLNVYGQNDSCILIRYPNYKVVVYESNYNFVGENEKEVFFAYQIPFGKSGNCMPWTPSIEVIKQIEEKMKPIIENYTLNNNSDSEREKDLRYIIQNINNYNRRYFSCVDKNGTNIIFIDFSIRREDDNLDYAEKELFSTIGGGANYFSITYNSDSNEVLSLDINAPW
jgi:hypothetical protein